jgi:hypothetical protein
MAGVDPNPPAVVVFVVAVVPLAAVVPVAAVAVVSVVSVVVVCPFVCHPARICFCRCLCCCLFYVVILNVVKDPCICLCRCRCCCCCLSLCLSSRRDLLLPLRSLLLVLRRHPERSEGPLYLSLPLSLPVPLFVIPQESASVVAFSSPFAKARH